MKILFIHPILGEMDPDVKKKRRAIFPPLALGALAGLTPPGIDVQMIDENLEEIDYGTDADLVAITAMTASAPRAYQIADRFRRQGIKVALGGMHVTSLPDEASQHADAVCLGEAESYWGDLLDDLRRGELRPRYGPGDRPNPYRTPPARMDLFGSDRYLLRNLLQTTRGCPFKCNFCSVTEFFGRTYRHRPIPDVLQELEKYRGHLVGFVDDNIMGHVRHAKEFFRAIKQMNIRWISQGSITMAKDDELLQLAADSGCVGMFIGFESLVEENLKEMNKTINRLDFYEQAIRKIQSYGIAIEGAFIFGFDGDDETIFERTVKFAKRLKLTAAQFGILTPFPGTGLYHKLMAEHRIFDFDWSHYDISRVVFRPKNMSPQTLQDGFRYAWKEFYTLPSIVRRLAFGQRRGYFPWALNFAFRNSVKHSRLGAKPRLEVPTEEMA